MTQDLVWNVLYLLGGFFQIFALNKQFIPSNRCLRPVPVAALSKKYVCSCSPAEIVTGDMDVCHIECCVLSSRGLCDGLITPTEEYFQVWCVSTNMVEEPHRVSPGALGLPSRNKNNLNQRPT
jgi:hypothetical protein